MDVRPGRRGILLPGPRLALDGHEPGHASLCSHAHGDHIPNGAKLTHATPATADILAHRAPRIGVERHAYGETFEVNGARVTFLPAGHVLGSALTRIEFEGETLLYTADFKLREPLTCDGAARGASVRADTLIIESTFGLPVYQFPGRDDVQRRAAAFAREVIDEGRVPVFLAYSLGKAQEMAAMLGRAGVPVQMQEAAWKLAGVYTAHGVDLPRVTGYDAETLPGSALVAAPNSSLVASVERAEFAYCSGWALLSGSRGGRWDAYPIPLSDHCDYPDLVRFVEDVQPSRVLVNHGFADVFSHILRGKGYDAAPLEKGEAQPW